MSFLCLKYSGLKFNFIFETNEFIFIPEKDFNNTEEDFISLEDFFALEYEKNSNFYVLSKIPNHFNLSLLKFSEEVLYRFKFLEAIIALLFSNFPRRKLIFILNKGEMEYKIKKVFKKVPDKTQYYSKSLIWKNKIIVNPLIIIIEDAFKKLEEIDKIHPDDPEKKKDFALRYYFCIDMYLRGKFGENLLRTISDLWISLEVLSTITISRILHPHEFFKVKGFYSKLKKVVKAFSSLISEDKIDCWNKLKGDFPEHMVNKINNYLPINQKIPTLSKNYLSDDDIKVKLPQKENFQEDTKYQEYLEASKEFRKYQEKITVEKIIKFFYNLRNKLFHSGKLNKNWSIEFDRYESNFIKILEQLFIKILDIKNVIFYQFGYPSQKILINLENKKSIKDFSKYYHSQIMFIRNHYILPLEGISGINYPKIKRHYIDRRKDLFSLRIQLNNRSEEINVFIKGTHIVEIKYKDNKFHCSLNLQDIKSKRFLFFLAKECNDFNGIYNLMQNFRDVIIKIKAKEKIKVKFQGIFNDLPDFVRGGVNSPLFMNPDYISFKLF